MDTLIKIKKRNGAIVDFDSEKIVVALKKAFFATRGVFDEGRIRTICEQVVQDLEVLFPPPDRVPTVEAVQDMVERRLMGEGFYDVAKSYIIYRYEHTKIREEEKEKVLEKIETERE